VYLRGRDTAFWAGHYGSKWAAPCLVFVPGGDTEGEAAEREREMDEALPPAPRRPPARIGGFRLVGMRMEVGFDARE
jgi:hypothetical protein